MILLLRPLPQQLFDKVPAGLVARTGWNQSPKRFHFFPNNPILNGEGPENQMDFANDFSSHPVKVPPARHLACDNRGKSLSVPHYLVGHNSCVHCNFPFPETPPVGHPGIQLPQLLKKRLICRFWALLEPYLIWTIRCLKFLDFLCLSEEHLTHSFQVTQSCSTQKADL